MTVEKIDAEVKLLLAKYPEYEGWFKNSPDDLMAISLDLSEAGSHADSGVMYDLSVEFDKAIIP